MREQEVPDIGTRVARKLNFEEFAQPFMQMGYQIKDEDIERIALMNECWDADNNPLTDNLQILFSSDSGSKQLRVIPACEFNPEEYEKLAEQLEKGQNAQAELQAIREKNSELENRIQQIKDELHGTKTGIKGLESQKETEEKALAALRNELAVLKDQKLGLDNYIADAAPKKDALDKEIEEKEAIKQGLEEGIEGARQEFGRVTQEHNDRLKRKEEIDQYIQDKDPAVKAIEKEIADITEERDKAKKLLEEEQDALKRARVSSAEERAELEEEYNQRSARMVARVKRQRENSRKRRERIAELDQKIADKKSALELLSQKKEEPAPAGKPEKPVNVKESEEYKALEKQLQARTFAVRKMLGTVLALEPDAKPDGAVLANFYRKIAELKKKEDPGVLVALNTLCAKLDEVAAEVLEQEPEAAEPKAKDSAIGWLVGKAKSAKDTTIGYIRKGSAKEKSEVESVEKTLEMSSYIGMLDKIMSAVKAYKEQVAGYKQAAEKAGAGARQAKEAPAGLDEKAERLLNELSDAVADVPAADEMADSAFMNQYVSEVRRCAFELYSIAASRDPEVLYFVLSELADLAYDDNKKAEAESFAARARDLCKEKLPDSLKEAEENLAFYRSELKE